MNILTINTDRLGLIATYRARPIYQDDYGFWWGRDNGYFDTEAECRAAIDSEIKHVRDSFIPPDDTPSLDAPWWEQR